MELRHKIFLDVERLGNKSEVARSYDMTPGGVDYHLKQYTKEIDESIEALRVLMRSFMINGETSKPIFKMAAEFEKIMSSGIFSDYETSMTIKDGAISFEIYFI